MKKFIFVILTLHLCSPVFAQSLVDKLKRKLEQASGSLQPQKSAEGDSSAEISPKSSFQDVPERSVATAAPPKNTTADKSPDFWCKDHAGLLSGVKVREEIIFDEFKIKELESLQDEFLDLVGKQSTIRAFDSPRLWISSFETKKVRGLYNAFVTYPEPATLAAIIEISRNAADKQQKSDGLMALAFIHLIAPSLSIQSERWSELHKAAGGEHWTALVFKARLHAFGEGGFKQDNRAALAYLNQASMRVAEYTKSQGRFEWDKANYAIPANTLASDIVSREPGRYPAWESFGPFLQQVQQARKEYSARWPSSRHGLMHLAANKLNRESEDLGIKAIELSQGGNAAAGAIANIKSLRQDAGGRETYAYIDPKVEKIVLNMVKQLSEVSGEQKKLIEQAAEKRNEVAGIMFQVDSEIAMQFQKIVFAGGDLMSSVVKISALQPVAIQTQETRMQACIFSAKWEQAMRAKKIDIPDKNKSAKNIEKFKDLKDE